MKKYQQTSLFGEIQLQEDQNKQIQQLEKLCEEAKTVTDHTTKLAHYTAIGWVAYIYAQQLEKRLKIKTK